ncbi:MAG: pilus assembly protein [Pseudomonadota bacterium]
MFIQSVSSQAKRLASRFARHDGGNIAMTFAVALVPLLGFVGAAVDYSRANAARAAMQVALDSAALMVSKDLSGNPTLSAADVTTKATAYFNALYTNTNASQVAVTASYTTNSKDGSTVTVNGTGVVATDFMKMVGFPQMGISGASTTTWGSTRMRVAIALDVTGSMDQDGKLPAMKTAAKNLIDTLKASASQTADVYISIIPFNVMVNVGISNKNASWLDWDTNYGSCSKSSYTTKSTCVLAGQTWTAKNVNKWQGCVTDRDKTDNYDALKTPPDVNTPGTLYLAQNYGQCPSEILPMKSAYDSKESDSSTDDNTLKGKINNLIANGNTNQAIGLHWAWISLQQGDPLNTPAKDANYKYTDVVILMSDGLNTQDRWYNQASQIDTRQALLCSNIKNSLYGSTIVYTIQVNTGNDPESQVLKNCASPTGQFFPATSISQMTQAFANIGSSLTKLRVSK